MARVPSHLLARRAFLRRGGLTVVALAACRPDEDTGGTESDTESPSDSDTESPSDSDTEVEACPLTGDNIEGPFYREDAPTRDDLDLYGEQGTPLTISGGLVDADCTPLAGAEVDLWHADPTGEYDNDSTQMRYRGITTTASDGSWQLTTLVPGWYLNGARYRPAHIHLKVRVDGVERLTTQLYFADDPYLEGDAFVEDAPVMEVVEADGAWSCSVELSV